MSNSDKINECRKSLDELIEAIEEHKKSDPRNNKNASENDISNWGGQGGGLEIAVLEMYDMIGSDRYCPVDEAEEDRLKAKLDAAWTYGLPNFNRMNAGKGRRGSRSSRSSRSRSSRVTRKGGKGSRKGRSSRSSKGRSSRSSRKN